MTADRSHRADEFDGQSVSWSSPCTPEGAERPVRRRYHRPLLRCVQLVAGEVLSLGCKTALGPTGPIGATCIAIPCVDNGS